jgi:twitching motility two-component system response regulator PilH
MILICPFCQTRYDLGDDRQPPETSPVRCRRCQETFLAGPENIHSGSTRNPPSGSSPGPIVVVAEENVPFRNLLCGVLKKQGVAVKVTSDGEQALEWVRKIKPQALFAAVFLRRMLGITLAERIRKLPELNATRIALIGHPLDRHRPAPDLKRLFGAQCYLEETLGPEPLYLRTGDFLGIRVEPENGDKDDGDGGTVAKPAAADTDSSDDGPIDETEEEIRRLGRVVASDLYLYYPSEVITAIKTDHLEDTFRDDLEKGKRMIEERFPGVPTATEIFLLSLKESLMHTAGKAGS